MTPRSIRRAAERKARKAEKHAVPVPETESPDVEEIASATAAPDIEAVLPEFPATQPQPISPARLAANHANAQFSTGPKTETGKANSSKNALKTALTGRTVLLPSDDADRYERHLAAYQKAYRPLGERELEMVQSLADTTWRIDRIPGIEEALYYQGSLEFDQSSVEFDAEVTAIDPRSQGALLRMHTFLKYEKQFRNLHIQEMRLQRQRQKLILEIKQLQVEREAKERDDLSIAAKLYILAKTDRKPFDPADHGFDFPTADVEAYLEGVRAARLTDKAMESGRFPQRAKAA
jgi:hypothetical protein